MADTEFNYEIVEDLGSFGDKKWQYHLTKISWNGREPKYDLRQWNDDMTKMSRGISGLEVEDLMDLYDILGRMLYENSADVDTAYGEELSDEEVEAAVERYKG